MVQFLLNNLNIAWLMIFKRMSQSNETYRHPYSDKD